MKRRRERINKALKELRKLQGFKKRVLNKGVKIVNTSTNKKRKKKSIEASRASEEGIGNDVREITEENNSDVESEEATT